MAVLIFDLLHPDKTYPTGSAEALWQELSVRFSDDIVAIYSSHLSRYTSATPDDKLFKELNDYGPLGKAAARFIEGYIGMAPNVPAIDPEAWTRRRDEHGRFITYTGGHTAGGHVGITYPGTVGTGKLISTTSSTPAWIPSTFTSSTTS